MLLTFDISIFINAFSKVGTKVTRNNKNKDNYTVLDRDMIKNILGDTIHKIISWFIIKTVLWFS